MPISMVVRPRHECGFERPGLFKRRLHQPCGCLGLVSYDSAAHTDPYFRDIALCRENAVSPLSADLAWGIGAWLGINL
jgi:hypothetical protein